ncbi:MAG: hypothetical protein KatS3mg017_0518 [Fimbriimonadales bacterium]|nr:MAG: hypothetical protein KatS3mg017_0518 [Fimbriimonadales bacterium]
MRVTHPIRSVDSATAGTPSRPQRDSQLFRACQEFESIFILQLWRAMQNTVSSQPKTLNYTEMFDVQFADYLAKHGRFGLAEQLYEQLSRHLPKEPTP